MTEEKGIVFNIQHFTVHDGPGIRTEVFLKGCPLRCKWCSNPESIDPRRQLGIYPAKCIGKDKCGYCVKACSKQGKPLIFNGDGIIVGTNMECIRCMKCTDACFTHAIKSWGNWMSVEEVMQEVMQDEIYYRQSGGGITINGGEVTVQWEFTLALLKASKERAINTCVETCMYCKPEILEKFYPYTDVFYADLKSMDEEIHKKWVGAGNQLILQNLIRTADSGIPLVLRIPIIPDINNSEENIRASAAFIADRLHNRVVQVQLLPYKKMGTEKYASMGIPYPMGEDYKMPPRAVWEANIRHLVEIMREYGVLAVPGSSSRIELSAN